MMNDKMINNTLKKTINKNNQYLLGIDKYGEKYYLASASWDCDWYWGFGYVKTKDSHQHFDGLFLNGRLNGHDEFKKFFIDTVLNDSEIWTLIELMKTFYTMKEYAEVVNRGGSHYTNNPCQAFIKNDTEYQRINKVVLPEIFKEIYKLLGGNEK